MSPISLEARIEQLERQVSELADEVLKLLADQRPTPTDGHTSSGHRAWVDMIPDLAQARLEHLQHWMARVLVHHTRVVSLLHPCWYQHPAVVQMLLDVRRSWEHAYRESPDVPHRALTWWQQDLLHLERELARELGHCTSVRHDPDRISLPLADPAEIRRHFTSP